MLAKLAFPFWNGEERRLRALVRIALQLVMMALLGGALAGSLGAFIDVGGHPLAAALLDTAIWIVIALGSSTSVWIACRVLDRRPFASLGVRLDGRFWLDALFGLALGIVLIGGIFAAELAFGWARYTLAPPESLGAPRMVLALLAVLPFAGIGIYEELVSRGYHLSNLAQGLSGYVLSPRAAVALAALGSSALFGILHARNPGATFLSTGNITLAGVMLALGYVVTGRLGISMGLHVSWNYCLNFFGMPVSGLQTFSFASVLVRETTGPELVTGGAFGPEAGLTGIVAMFAGTFLILAWVRFREGELRIVDELAVWPSRAGATP